MRRSSSATAGRGSVKERQAESEVGTGRTIDFMVLKSITMVSDNLKAFRRSALEGSQCRLTARPYTWYEFAGLLETLRAIKQAGLPRSQLYRLRDVLLDALDIGPQASSLEYLTTRVRQNHDVANALRTYVEGSWRSASDVANGAPPWMRLPDKPDNPQWETIWADLIEIYDMVPEKEAAYD
jgi:CRISPR-associated protein Cmr2